MIHGPELNVNHYIQMPHLTSSSVRRKEEEKMPNQPKRKEASLSDLRLFHALATLLPSVETVKEAADALNVAEGPEWSVDAPRLYKHLKFLEGIIGAKAGGKAVCLVHRSSRTHKHVLSPEGERFYKMVGRFLEEYGQLFKVGPECRETLRIGGTETLLTFVLPAVLAKMQFETRHPNVDIRLFEGELWEITSWLTGGKVDLAVGPWDPSGNQHQSHEILRLNRCLHFHKDHPRLGDLPSKDFRLEMLATETVIVLPEPNTPGLKIAQIVPPPEPGKGRRIVLPNMALAYAWVKRGLGVAVGLPYLGTVLPEDEEVVRHIDLGHLRYGDDRHNYPMPQAQVHLYLPSGGEGDLPTEAARELAVGLKEHTQKIFTPAPGRRRH
jgi:DNA-binding transcriptional LysR family regulator